MDFAAWFAGTRALAAYGDAELWEAWSGNARRILVSRQRKYADGCGCGSWDPVDRWGREGGRVYATAMNALTLGIRNPDTIADFLPGISSPIPTGKREAIPRR